MGLATTLHGSSRDGRQMGGSMRGYVGVYGGGSRGWLCIREKSMC